MGGETIRRLSASKRRVVERILARTVRSVFMVISNFMMNLNGGKPASFLRVRV